MKSLLHTTLLFLSLAFTSLRATSQGIGNNLVFDQITRKQGLPDDWINFIFQDSRGFMWLATNHGLSRYDGRSFKNYNTLGKNGITDMIVHSITEDKKGNIWFGTESGLNKLDPFTENITQYQEGAGSGTIPYHWCNYLYLDKDKQLWLTTERGLALYHEDADSFQNFKINVFGKDDRINKFINKVVEDNEGKLWLSTSYGIKAFDKKTGTYISYTKEETNDHAKKENVFYALFIDHAGTIWAGTFSEGLRRFNKAANAFEKVNIEGVNRPLFTINDISEIKVRDSNYLILATTGGLACLDRENKGSALVSYSLVDHDLNKIFKDKQQNLWIGSADGFFKLNSSSLAFRWLPAIVPSKESHTVYHIIPDIKNPGSILYLTSPSGWFTYDTHEQTITPKLLPPDANASLPFINDWWPDEGGYWFTSVTGFGYYDLYKNRMQDLSQPVLAASGELSTGRIVKATDESLWVGMKRSGILVYNIVSKKDTVIFGDKNKPGNTYGRNIWDIKKDQYGSIWFAASDKLYCADPVSFSFKTFSPPPWDGQVAEEKIAPLFLLFTRNKRLLVGSNLRIYEFKNDRLVTVYPAEGFSNFSMEAITEDPEGGLWVRTENGVFKTDSSFTRWQSMNILPGLEGTPISEINATRPGEILLASDAKIGVLEQKLLQKSDLPPSVIISRVRFGEKENYLASMQHAAIKSSFKDAIEITLSPVNFIDEKENKILYRLNGWDDQWVTLNEGSTVRYEQLPPGDYTFVAKAVNAAGMESQETTMSFSVTPPFYRTWWFISLIVILLIAAAFLFYRFRLKKALELERMRTRIATDLHDDIGATLSSISIYSQVVKDQLKEKNPNLETVLDKMGENSRDMVTSMNDIVWAINPANDHGEKLVTRMGSYAIDICAVKNIQLHFNADERLNNISLPVEHRKNVYLIFKEAVNNAVKYADPKSIEVSLTLRDKEIILVVKDDGIGFDELSVIKGNGLKNFEIRAKEIKGHVSISSAKEQGTAISLVCRI